MPTERKRYRRYIDVSSNDGKRHRIVVSAYSEKELEQKYREKMMELAKNDFRFTKKATLRSFFSHYMEYYLRPDLRPGARHDKEARLQRYLIDPLGDREFSRITAQTLQQLLNSHTGKSRSFLSKLKGEITAFFAAAEEEDLITRNPCRNLFLPPCENKSRRALTEEERKAFLAAAKKHRHGTLYLFMYYCGLRPGEARALMPADINYIQRTVTIKRAIEERTGEIKDPKTKSGFRTIPIPDALFELIPKRINTKYLFPGEQKGSIITKASCDRAWKAILNLMDIEMGAKRYRNKILPETSVLDRSITPYYLRHTYCSILAEKEIDIKTAQYFMGHSSIAVTANIYQHVTERMFVSGADKLRDF
ncbi:MAG: site-specific integrase [Clostridia bacterium]|nr:site-specific integrase [Clostridia bacterium]